MRINTFITLFWILYFPLCIAFYEYVNDYVDEVMTLVLVLFTLMKMGSRHINRKPIKEAGWCVAILTGYLIYSLILQVNVPMASIIDYQQQVRPYAVFFCTMILAPMFTRKQKWWMLTSVLLTFVSYIIFKFNTLGEEENVTYGALAMSSALAYYFLTKQSAKNRNIAICIALVGILSGKFKYFGECTAFITILLLLHKRLNFKSIKLFFQVGVLGVLVLFFAWERFEKYFITGLDNKQLARPMIYKTTPKILRDYFPFGPGLATFGTSASAKKYYSKLYYDYKLDQIWGMSPNDRGAFNADSFYPSLAQFGVVGIFFFLWFWKRRLKEINTIQDVRYYKVALSAMMCLAIESVADTSYLSGRGMAYFMIMGIALNSNRYLCVKRTSPHLSMYNK